MSKIKDAELISIVQKYNNEGRVAAYELISNHGIKYPFAIIKRIKNHPKFVYDKDSDSFTYQENSNKDNVFLSMEELCSHVSIEPEYHQKNRMLGNRTEAMEKLIQELLGDRLLELSKYIILEP